MFKVFYDDIEIGQTERYGAYEVTREEVIDFARKYDPQPFHLDDEAAKQSVFGALCASGWHTCAMMMRMLVDNLTEQKSASMGSPGVDAIRWKQPCFPGDILSVESTVTEKRDSASRPKIGFLKSDLVIKNQRDEVVMTVTTNYMMLKRP